MLKFLLLKLLFPTKIFEGYLCVKDIEEEDTVLVKEAVWDPAAVMHDLRQERAVKLVSNCNFFGAARSLRMYMTSATTNVLTHPVLLPSRCFYLPAPFVIHFWKPEVPEGRYQIEKYSSLLPPTTNSVAEKRSDGQKNRGFESRRECTVAHKPLSPMYRLMVWRVGLVSLLLIHKQVLFFPEMLRDSHNN